MKRKYRNLTVISLTGAVTSIGIVVFIYWKPLVETYWISQIDNPEKRIMATKKLAEFKTNRATPHIIQEFSEMLKAEGAQNIYIYGLTDPSVYSFSPEAELPPTQLTFHPMLYSIYSMGSGSKKYIEEMLQGHLKEEIAKLQSQENTQVANRLASLLQALVYTIEIWQTEKLHTVAEGPERRKKKREPFR